MPTPLQKKLRIQPGQQMAVINAPKGYLKELGDLPEDARWVDLPAKNLDFVHLFVKNRVELEQLRPQAMECVKYDGLLWISYPKKSAKVESDLSRDILWELMKGTGFRPVTQVSVDDVWSALRFRPEERVG